MHPSLVTLLAATESGKLPIIAIGAALFACFLAFGISLIRFAMTRKVSWVVVLVLSLLIGAILTNYGTSRALEIVKERQKEKTFSSSDDALSIVAPATWTPMPELHPTATLKLGSTRRNQHLIVISEPIKHVSVELEEYAATTSGGLQASIADAQSSEPKPLTIGGHPAVQYEIDGIIKMADGKPSANVAYLHTSVKTDDAYHQFVMWTMKANRNAAFPVFESILASATFQPGKVVAEPEASEMSEDVVRE